MLSNRSGRLKTRRLALLAVVLVFSACTSPESGPKYSETGVNSGSVTDQSSGDMVAMVTGLLQPEAVRYDPETDAWFISNFNGAGSGRDANGFITKVDAESGELTSEFIVGGDQPLHAPRGMYIVDNVLWVADVDGVHGFDKHSGEQLEFVDFSMFEHGFLNDVAADRNGGIYVTETGGGRVFKIIDNEPGIWLSDIPNPNGITFDDSTGALLLAPWDEGDFISLVDLATDSLTVLIEQDGSKIDGIESHKGRLILAAQSDSTIKIYEGAELVGSIKTDGKPADIGIDTRRNRIAVPYIALNRVDIWQLPE